MKKISLLMVLCLSVILAGCGYKLAGTSKSIPSHVNSVYIKDFNNKTVNYQAEVALSKAIRKEFIQRSGLNLVSSQDMGDSIVEGDILEFEIRPVSSSGDYSNAFAVKLKVSVRFIDFVNKQLIYENKNLSVENTFSIQTGAYMDAQGETLEKIADEVAETIVIGILENF